jgi:nucleoside-triphosphatase THEP1
MTTVIKAIARTVVLGNPGGGKTTLAQKPVHLLTTRPDDPHVAGRRLTPLFVTLRDYT